MKVKKPSPLDSLKAARDQLASAIGAGATLEARLAELRVKLAALKAETEEPLDPLDREAVTKRAAALGQIAAIETELQNSEAIRAENAAAIHNALQNCSGPIKAIVSQQAQNMSKRLEEFLAPFCKDATKAAHVAGQCDALAYLNAATSCWWAVASNSTTATWVLNELVTRLLSERPVLWPAPPKLIADSASMA